MLDVNINNKPRVDLLKPDNDIFFKLKHFKEKLSQCGVFFNFLTNLNKLVAYEQRDPFAVKHELTEHPNYSDWDRFAQQEYLRLAMEEENQDNVKSILLLREKYSRVIILGMVKTNKIESYIILFRYSIY